VAARQQGPGYGRANEPGRAGNKGGTSV
jgi:hypothetical protein